MSSDRPHAAPSPAASSPAATQLPHEPGAGDELASVLTQRGGPLLDALEAHFPGSRDQAEAASSYAFAAAVELGLTRPSAELIRAAARLHDVGRVYVPAEVLAKPAWSRTPDEGALVESHHAKGAGLARGAGVPERVCEWIRLGGERYDGGGPNRLAGAAIPLQARISRAAHACYAALVEPAPERPEPTHHQPGPIGALRAGAARELDPMVVGALAAVLRRAGQA